MPRTRCAGWLCLGLIAAACGTGCDPAAKQRAEESGSIFALFSEPKPIDAARDMVNPYDPDKRFRGTTLIANAPFGGTDVYVKVYEDQVKNDPDVGVRGIAARALSLHGRPEHALLIVPLLKEKERMPRLEAARALQRIHNPAVVDALIAAVDSRKEVDAEVRAEAAIALGQYAENKVLQGLIAAVDDDSLTAGRAARESLKTLTGQELGEDMKAWLAWFDKTKEPFAGRTQYIYPVFNREFYWIEYLPFVSPPPNEVASTPVGMTPQ